MLINSDHFSVTRDWHNEQSLFSVIFKESWRPSPPLIIINTAENRNKPVSASDKREIQISPGVDEKSWKWILQDVVLQEESEL